MQIGLLLPGVFPDAVARPSFCRQTQVIDMLFNYAAMKGEPLLYSASASSYAPTRPMNLASRPSVGSIPSEKAIGLYRFRIDSEWSRRRWELDAKFFQPLLRASQPRIWTHLSLLPTADVSTAIYVENLSVTWSGCAK